MNKLQQLRQYLNSVVLHYPHRLVWLSVFLSLCLFALMSWRHIEQKNSLNELNTQIETLQQARLDLSQGFLLISLNDTNASPLNRASGIRLLNQAIAALAQTPAEFNHVTPLFSQLTTQLQQFSNEFSDWQSSGTNTALPSSHLILAYKQFAQTSENTSKWLKNHLQTAMNKLHDDYYSEFLRVMLIFSFINSLLFQALLSNQKARIHVEKMADRHNRAERGTQQGLWEWNLSTNQAYLSPECKALLELSDEEQSFSDSFYTRLHPDDKALLDTALIEHIEQGKAYDIEFRLLTQTGQYHWFQSRGQVERIGKQQTPIMTGLIIDIHVRKAMEIALKESQAALQVAQNMAHMGKLGMGFSNPKIDLV